ncbi:hypothetical protein F7R23_04845 [Burkholderia diffusa]|nr:hypothetical protein F7R23_04845 [Burkholderia diffusa]
MHGNTERRHASLLPASTPAGSPLSAWTAAFGDWARTGAAAWLYLFKALLETFIALGVSMRLDLPAPKVAQALQAQRDNSRIGKAPSRTHRGDSTRTNRNEAEPGKKKQREITQADVEHVIVNLAQRRRTAKPANKPGRRSAKAGETTVSALPVQAPTFDTA